MAEETEEGRLKRSSRKGPTNMITISYCDQRSEEWFKEHLAIASASVFAEVMMTGKRKGEPSVTRAGLLRKKAGEAITGYPDPSGYTNRAMERGIEMENEARTKYQFLNPDAELTRVGFIRNSKAGCSPDSLIGNDGVLEIKTTWPHLLLDHHLKGEFPPEHRPQCQGQLWVAERDWVDLCIYWPAMRPFIIRAHRDEQYIKEIEEAVDRFNYERDELIKRYREGA